ncbi:hypothetical protein RHMOL_Rhmol12G0108700 [Rhododendron molle]|uniref:Uncharacterized protein n=1 Tax=Rhododendron molle TaxID=49168 RepID=A0ACC0LHY2_RHOML|nr:hypothetical protein RHMOL_Rhmol12G0108700 [Rhododendron molle]
MGDSWFNCQKLRLPENFGLHKGMNFRCSIDLLGGRLSVGATLSYAHAVKDKSVITCIGDGSFQEFYSRTWQSIDLLDGVSNFSSSSPWLMPYSYVI